MYDLSIKNKSKLKMTPTVQKAAPKIGLPTSKNPTNQPVPPKIHALSDETC